MAAPTDTATNATSGATDAAKSLTGGRKPQDIATAGDSLKDPVGPVTDPDEKSSLRIHIKLDLDVEVHLTARVKGDITIGLL